VILAPNGCSVCSKAIWIPTEGDAVQLQHFFGDEVFQVRDGVGLDRQDRLGAGLFEELAVPAFKRTEFEHPTALDAPRELNQALDARVGEQRKRTRVYAHVGRECGRPRALEEIHGMCRHAHEHLRDDPALEQTSCSWRLLL
jgi:hypothetical protein